MAKICHLGFSQAFFLIIQSYCQTLVFFPYFRLILLTLANLLSLCHFEQYKKVCLDYSLNSYQSLEFIYF